MSYAETAVRAVREYKHWSRAELRKIDEITVEVLEHCRDGNGNPFIREWCARNLPAPPAVAPIFDELRAEYETYRASFPAGLLPAVHAPRLSCEHCPADGGGCIVCRP